MIKAIRFLILLAVLIAQPLVAGPVDTDGDGLSDSFETTVTSITLDETNPNDVVADDNSNSYSNWADHLFTESGLSGSIQQGSLVWDHEALDDVAAYPVVGDDGTLFVISRDRTLYALNPNGTTLWTYDFDAYVEHAPAIGADGTLYVVTGTEVSSGAGNGKIHLIAISETGVEAWRYEMADRAVASPVIAESGAVYLVTQDSQLTAIDASGNELWTFTGDSTMRHAPAIDADGSVLVPTKDKLWRLSVDGIGIWVHFFEGQIAATPAVDGLGNVYVPIRERELIKLDAWNNKKWSFALEGYAAGSPAITLEGNIIIGDTQGNVYSIDPDGNNNWSSPDKFVADDVVSTSIVVGRNEASPASNDTRIYFGTRSRKFYALDESGAERWTVETDGYIVATPALTKFGVIYVVDKEGKLYAFADDVIGHVPWAMQHKNTRGNSHQCWSPEGYLYAGVDSDGDGTNDCQQYQEEILSTLPAPPTAPPEGSFGNTETLCFITTGNSSCSVDVTWDTEYSIYARLYLGATTSWIDEGLEGDYLLGGVTTIDKDLEIRDFLSQSVLGQLTVKGGSGSLTGSSKCEIWPGQNSCQLTTSWSTTNLETVGAGLWKSINGGTWTKISTALSSSDTVTLSGGDTVSYQLHAKDNQTIELANKFVRGVVSSGSLSTSASQCEIASGDSTCDIFVSWSTANTAAATLWQKIGSGPWTVFESRRSATNRTIPVGPAGVTLELRPGDASVTTSQAFPGQSVTLTAVDADTDGDGVPDVNDNCPLDANPLQTDTDLDGAGDACDTSNDDDSDGVDNSIDNCPTMANANQLDTDSDGLGDVCDGDDDNDGHSDATEATCGSDPLDALSVPPTSCFGSDTDGDGVADGDDAFPNDNTETADSDSDGKGDNAELDDDNDGVPDDSDAYPADNTRWLGSVVSMSITPDSETHISTTTEPGPTPYTASVSADGLSTIAIPIQVIPGVNGLAPALALTYDSGRMGYQSDNDMTHGSMGYGWAVEGISSIRRCEDRSSTAGDITFTNSDKLCLDGELLVAISGSYFGAGTEYRTERDTFAKITASGSGFEVKTHEGLTLTYGLSLNGDHRVKAGDINVDYIWALQEQRDSYDNTVSYDYIKDDATGEIYPKTITYNDAVVSFDYAHRAPREVTRVDVGSGFALSSVFLHKIAVSFDGKAVRDYVLHTEQENGRRVLKAVQHCGFDTAGSNRECLNPINITWDATQTYVAVDKLTDSLGAETKFSYVAWVSGKVPALTAETNTPAFNTAGTSCTVYSTHLNGDTLHYNRRAYVTQMTTSNGVGAGVNAYKYYGKSEPVFMQDNRGYAGHEVVVQRDESDTTDITTYSQMETCFPYAGLVAASYTYEGSTHASNELSVVENDWQSISLHGGATSFVYAKKSLGMNYESGSPFGALETETTYTMANNLPSEVVVVEKTAKSAALSAGSWTLTDVLNTVTTDLDFSHDTTNWLNAFVNSVGTTHTDGTETKASTTTFTRVAGKMAINSVTESRGSAGTLTTTFGYDAKGNPASVQQSGTSLSSRTTTLTEYEHFRYPGKITNPVGEEVTYTFDPRFGTPTTVTTPDGRSSLTKRDVFGRVVHVEDTTSNNHQLIEVDFDNASGSVYGHARAYQAVVSNSAAPKTVHTFDQLGRRVSQARAGFKSGDWVLQDVGYDFRGRMTKESVPYIEAGLPIGASNHVVRQESSYDIRNRLISRDMADGGELDVSYTLVSGELKVTQTETIQVPGSSAATIDTVQYLNALGQLVKTTDDNNTDTVFAYDPLGSLKSTQVGSHPTTTMAYDAVGQRTSISEPHTGTTSFNYTALGQVASQTNAAGRIISYFYDNAGRLIQRIDDDQLSSQTVNRWTYGTIGADTGRLVTERQDIGDTGSDEFTRTYRYDLSSGKPEAVSTTVDNADVTETIHVTYTYDSQGRVDETTYDDNDDQAGNTTTGVTARNVYNGQGYHYKVTREDGNNSVNLQTIKAQDAFGNSEKTTFANGVTTTRTFDPTSGRLNTIETLGNGAVLQDLSYTWRTDGSLKTRKDGPNTETFAYDSLRRLVSATVNNATGRTLNYSYDALGNLLSKTSSVAADVDVTGYTYGSAGPNAVTNVTVGGDATSLAYDATGNVTAINPTTGDDRTFTYNAHNLVTNIDVKENGTNTVVASEAFAYGGDNQRYFRKSEWEENNSTVTTYTIYAAGGKVERNVTSGQSNNTKIQLTKNVIVKKESEHTFFMHRDHLGSLHKMTNARGKLLLSFAFDPFAGRRNSDWNSSTTAGEYLSVLDDLDEINNLTSRGFTGHEPLDRTGVIHMNGRIYDPEIGRFLNADPIVQAPRFSQSHNRYSYVMNNPLSYTDPSGFICIGTSFGFSEKEVCNGGGGDLFPEPPFSCDPRCQEEQWPQGPPPPQTEPSQEEEPGNYLDDPEKVHATMTGLNSQVYADIPMPRKYSGGIVLMSAGAGGLVACGFLSGGGCLAVPFLTLLVGTNTAFEGATTIDVFEGYFVQPIVGSDVSTPVAEVFEFVATGGVQGFIKAIGIRAFAKSPRSVQQAIEDSLARLGLLGSVTSNTDDQVEGDQ